MDQTVYKSNICRVHLRKGEAIKIQNEDSALQELTCEDMARLAWAMHDHMYFFWLRRGLNIEYCRDCNGGGTQSVSITRQGDDKDPEELLEAVFGPALIDDDFIYEADLIMDRGKDYEPTVNKGKYRFAAEWAAMQIAWNDVETQQWRSDLGRLSRSSDTLLGWIEADLEMLVRCKSDWNCRRKGAILSRTDLERYAAAGVTLEDLKARLKCTQCGERKSSIKAF